MLKLVRFVQDPRLQPLLDHYSSVCRTLGDTAHALFVIQGDKVVLEHYHGHHFGAGSRQVQADSRFNVHSVRKSYLGLAVSIAISEGKMHLDEEIPDLEGTTLRHLLTHTHGLRRDPATQKLTRVSPAGTDWEYTNAGIEVATLLLEKAMGQTLSQLVKERVFDPLGFQETGWCNTPEERLVSSINRSDEMALSFGGDPNDPAEGYERNLFVSARELAYWGYFHLKRGQINGQQIVPASVIDLASTVQSPLRDNRQNGLCWWLNQNGHPQSELGDDLPSGSYQILGTSGCLLLVIPALVAVVVRMQNKGNIPGFDYLHDVKSFGNLTARCLTPPSAP